MYLEGGCDGGFGQIAGRLHIGYIGLPARYAAETHLRMHGHFLLALIRGVDLMQPRGNPREQLPEPSESLLHMLVPPLSGGVLHHREKSMSVPCN